MCPQAHAAVVKYHYQDHDTDEVDETPPVLNTWYEFFDAEDVRLLWCAIYQTNDEAAAKTIEVRWTIDGNVYLITVNVDSGVYYFIYRFTYPSAGGTTGLISDKAEQNAARFIDKRGQSFKAEVRITAAPGTNQRLLGYCVRETLELT